MRQVTRGHWLELTKSKSKWQRIQVDMWHSEKRLDFIESFILLTSSLTCPGLFSICLLLQLTFYLWANIGRQWRDKSNLEMSKLCRESHGYRWYISHPFIDITDSSRFLCCHAWFFWNHGPWPVLLSIPSIPWLLGTSSSSSRWGLTENKVKKENHIEVLAHLSPSHLFSDFMSHFSSWKLKKQKKSQNMNKTKIGLLPSLLFPSSH